MREAWGDARDVKSAIETLSEVRDSAVWVDFLRVLNARPTLFTLEGAVVILPLVNEILFEVYEE